MTTRRYDQDRYFTNIEALKGALETAMTDALHNVQCLGTSYYFPYKGVCSTLASLVKIYGRNEVISVFCEWLKTKITAWRNVVDEKGETIVEEHKTFISSSNFRFDVIDYENENAIKNSASDYKTPTDTLMEMAWFFIVKHVEGDYVYDEYYNGEERDIYIDIIDHKNINTRAYRYDENDYQHRTLVLKEEFKNPYILVTEDGDASPKTINLNFGFKG